jgi:hypothetical protein
MQTQTIKETLNAQKIAKKFQRRKKVSKKDSWL